MGKTNSLAVSVGEGAQCPLLANRISHRQKRWGGIYCCRKPELAKRFAGFLWTPVFLLMSGGVAVAMPFNSFDPRSMAMGGTGVAVGDPSTAPFFNPAMLTATPLKKYSVELPVIGAIVSDPGDVHTNLQSAVNSSNALTNHGNILSINATVLADSISALADSILVISVSSLATATTAAAAITTVTTSMSSVASNMTVVGNNATAAGSEINNINHLLLAMNNQPLQAEFGAATVVGIPGEDWGFAFYADAWGAMGGTLIYNDAGTVSTIASAASTIGTALTSSGAVTAQTATALAAATTSLNAAITDCAASNLSSSSGINTCANSLTIANANVAAANSSLTSTTNTLGTNATKISNAANSINQNVVLQSKLHLRGVFIEESGLSISHHLPFGDQSWSVGITPKVMNLHLFDAKLSVNNGINFSGLTSSDYLAEYNTVNFDAGVAKTFFNGWRTGVVVKNVVPQTYDFKNAPTTGGTPVPDGASLTMNPQARFGMSYENQVSTVAFDIDLTRNDPVGLENYSQYIGIGGELSAFGWAQLRAGYHYDLLDPRQPMASIGFGVSPRIPYFKPHLDFAITASPNILANGWDGATQLGISLKAGVNF